MGRKDRPLKVPADAELLTLFCELVAEYDRLGAAFPVSVASFELGPDQQLDETERWHRIVRAMALRKFVLGNADHARADHVLRALKRSLLRDEDRLALTQLEQDFDLIGRRMTIDEGPNGQYTLAQVLEDLIYGTYLHGDLDRRARSSARWNGSIDLALWMFSEDAEFYIRRLRSAILLAAAEGKLKSLANQAVRRAVGS